MNKLFEEIYLKAKLMEGYKSPKEFPYAVRFRVFKVRDSRIVTLQKKFKTKTVMENFYNRIEQDGNFYEFVSYSYSKNEN
jgi:hypothetical protein